MGFRVLAHDNFDFARGVGRADYRKRNFVALFVLGKQQPEIVERELLEADFHRLAVHRHHDVALFQPRSFRRRAFGDVAD